MAEGDWKMGFNEVQVGIPLPPVILSALRRQVGPRQAERLGTGGLVISATEAARTGLVDELASLERVVERAVAWCQTLLTLPPQAMSVTRQRSRADLAGYFGAPGKAGRFQRVRFPPRKGEEPPHRESSLGLMKVTT